MEILPVRIHGKKEAVVAVGHQLPFGRQTLHRFALQNAAVGVDVIEQLSIEYLEPRVYPTVSPGLFVKCNYLTVTRGIQNSEAGLRMHCGDGGDFSVALVKRKKLRDVHISQT